MQHEILRRFIAWQYRSVRLYVKHFTAPRRGRWLGAHTIIPQSRASLPHDQHRLSVDRSFVRTPRDEIINYRSSQNATKNKRRFNYLDVDDDLYYRMNYRLSEARMERCTHISRIRILDIKNWISDIGNGIRDHIKNCHISRIACATIKFLIRHFVIGHISRIRILDIRNWIRDMI